MYNEKIDNLLNLSLNSTPEEFSRSRVLQVGFDEATKIWDVIVKYAGSLAALKQKFPQIQTQELLFQYAILRIPENLLDMVANDVQISYMEKPRNLFFAVSCLHSTAAYTKNPQTFLKNLPNMSPYPKKDSHSFQVCQLDRTNLTGRGTLIAIIDSGIDYAHPDFRNEDGTTRILLLWDQTLNRVFDSSQINQALAAPTPQERYQIVPSRDLSGHGTHVAGIAAGNGRASDGQYTGMAPEADLIVVKLGTQRPDAFPRTTELMSAVDFSLRQAYAFTMPLVINLSFGNNYGGHDGTSLLETYLENAASYWKSLIVTGTGNEGDSGIHTEGILSNTTPDTVEFSVGAYETGFNIQLWKNFADEMRISLVAPSGETIGTLQPELGTQRFRTAKTDILVYYGMPAPYSVSQEIFFDFIPTEDYVDTGIWNLLITPIKIVDGSYNLWLPSQAAIGSGTAFLRPIEETTLTIPSTTSKLLSVGAYDARFLTMASFSGRGYTRVTNLVKPDVVAPGVNIISTAPGGGYTTKSGTSMAAPYASGLAALMMEDGIVNGNDPFLFGSKIIAYMHREALPLPGFSSYPNPVTGWGRLV